MSWDLSAITRPVQRAERRLRLDRALEISAAVLVGALAVAIGVVVLRKIGIVREGVARGVLVGVGAAWLATAVAAYLYRLAPKAGAIALDRHHRLADRLSSALEFGALPQEQRTDFMDATIADALEHASAVDPRRAVPIDFPSELKWALPMLALLVGVSLFEVRHREVIASAKTIDALEVTPDDLDAVREFLKDMEQRPLGDDTKAAIAEFNQLVNDLADKRLDRTEAFRKLQALEDKLLEGREASAKDLEEALAKMGEELKKSDNTKPAGEALSNKNLAEASDQLRELAKKMREQGVKFDKAQIEKMREALKKAAESQSTRKAALDKRREELQKELLKQKEKVAQKKDSEEEKNLLKKKERELERLDREKEQQEKTGRQLDRLDRELSQAAEDLMKDLGLSADDLDNSAEDINRMAREKMTDQEKEQLRQRLQELRETLRQQGKGGKQQMARLQRFQKHARGSGGKGGQQGQGQQQQGQGQEQDGQGQEGQDGQEGQGQEGQGQQQGQGKNGQGEGETWVLGPGGQKMLMLSKGQGSQSSGGGGQDKGGQGAGTERGGPTQGAATNLKGQTQDSQVAGQDTGEGSSRSEVIQGAAERGFASRGYTKVYREYKNVAEEALNHEEIPGGYRFYVRRYFLLIRPRENP